MSEFFCYLNSSKNITCPLGKLKTEFTSPIAESTSPGPTDTTFFACCIDLKVRLTKQSWLFNTGLISLKVIKRKIWLKRRSTISLKGKINLSGFQVSPWSKTKDNSRDYRPYTNLISALEAVLSHPVKMSQHTASNVSTSNGIVATCSTLSLIRWKRLRLTWAKSPNGLSLSWFP